MTKEEAIKVIRKYECNKEHYEACETAIKALEQEACEDGISRQAVLDTLDKHTYSEEFCIEHHIDWAIDLGMAKIAINDLPSVTPQPKIGKWVSREDMDYLDENKVVHHHFMCQDCGFIHDFVDGHTTQYKHCPSCGVKMVESENKE